MFKKKDKTPKSNDPSASEPSGVTAGVSNNPPNKPLPSLPVPPNKPLPSLPVPPNKPLPSLPISPSAPAPTPTPPNKPLPLLPPKSTQVGGNNKTRKYRRYIHDIKQNRRELFNKEMEIINSIRKFKHRTHKNDVNKSRNIKRKFIKQIKRY